MKENKKKATSGNSKQKTYQLILLNDDENTFDDVIEILMEFCGYTIYQAEQCAVIVDNNGKVVIRTGTQQKINKMANLLRNEGLNVDVKKEQ